MRRCSAASSSSTAVGVDAARVAESGVVGVEARAEGPRGGGGGTTTPARDPPPARRSLDETRRDAAARPGAKRARTDANASKTSLGLPARRSLDLDRASLDAAAAAAAAAEDLHACDTAWGEPSSALTREMSWADIHEALAGAERARRSAP